MGVATGEVSAADLGSLVLDEDENDLQAPIQEEAASDPAENHSQGNGRHSKSGEANGFRKAPAKEKKTSPGSSNPRLKASRSNFTVPQPFSLTTEIRATLAGSAGSKPTSGNGMPTPPPKTQKVVSVKKFESPAAAAQTKSAYGSPLAAGSTPRSKAEFVFRSDERAQKRMEFYANLSEKSKAREAERSRLQANTQQRVAAEIKKLRKDQTFKATPMPKFYQEPAPVRIDVKKTPPTRPKSPKLGRRLSEDPLKIIARRSSDEYEISKIPAADIIKAKLPEEKLVLPPEEQQQQALHEYAIAAEEEGSEHGSSRKSESLMIPKAALSEDENHASSPEVEAEAVAGGNEGSESLLNTSRSSLQTPVSVAENLDDEVLQLPVASSLLLDDDDGEDEEVGSDYEDHRDAADEEDEDENEDEEDEEQQESVRVYISEEFRQAAEDNHKDSEEDDPITVKS